MYCFLNSGEEFIRSQSGRLKVLKLEYCVYNYIDWCSITAGIDIILFRLLYLINLYEFFTLLNTVDF